MKLQDDQKNNIIDTLKVYIAAIPVENGQDLSEVIFALNSLQLGKKTANNAINKIDAYLNYLLKCDPDIKQELNDLVADVISERVNALKQIQLDPKEIEAYSRAQKKLGLGESHDKYTPIIQAIVDLWSFEGKIQEEKKDYLKTLNRFIDLKYFDGIESVLTNQYVLSALQKNINFFKDIYDAWDDYFPQLASYAEIITTVRGAEKLCDYGLLNFNRFRKMTPDELTTYITSFTSPTLLALLEESVPLRKAIDSLSLKEVEDLTEMLEHPIVKPLILSKKIPVEIKGDKKGDMFKPGFTTATDRDDYVRFSLRENDVRDGVIIHDENNEKVTFSGIADKEKIIAMATTMSHPAVQPYVNSGLIKSYKVSKWGHEQTLNIAAYLAQSPAKELVDSDLLKFVLIDNLDDLKTKTAILSRFKKDIQDLVNNKVIKLPEVAYFAEESAEACQDLIKCVQQNAKYHQLGILHADRYLYSSKWRKHLNECVEELNRLPTAVHEFLAKNIYKLNVYIFIHRYIYRVEKEKQFIEERKVLFDALWYPQIREILQNKALTPGVVIANCKDKGETKKSFITALSDPIILQRAQDDKDPVFTKDDRDENLILVGKLLTHPSVFPLFQLGYLTADEIIEYRRRQPGVLAALAKYKLLLELEKVANDPSWKKLGKLGINVPDGIGQLKTALAGLDKLSTVNSQLENTLTFGSIKSSGFFSPKNYQMKIDSIYNEVFKLLELKQDPYKGKGKREEKTTTTYRNEYEKLLEFQTISSLSTHYQLAHKLLEQGDNQNAYHNFIQVVETDENFLDAMWEAANIALTSGNYGNARFLLLKAQDVAKEKMDEQFISQIAVLLEVSEKRLKGESYNLDKHKPEKNEVNTQKIGMRK